ncbi:MAG TPA: hypothetical protein VK421_06050 [Pyrinomonadaceae bacterium]|nr:hypothetical protein [Pyrinomonadaceae bacterium]
MGDKYLDTTVTVAISEDRQTDLATYSRDDADFLGARMDNAPFPVPTPEYIDDSDQIGAGDEDRAGTELRLHRWPPFRIPVSGKANTQMAARLLLRGAGGTVTNAVVSAGAVWDASAGMQKKSEGTTPVATTMVSEDGGRRFLWPSMLVNSFGLIFSGGDPVRFESELINLGGFVPLGDIVGGFTMPEAEEYEYMHPAGCRVTFNDGVPRDYAATGRLISGRAYFTNNIDVPTLPGDTPFADNDYATGTISKYANRGPRGFEAGIQIYGDDTDFDELSYILNRTPLANLTYLFRGDKITATHYHELEVVAPLVQLRTIGRGNFNGFATLNLDFFVKPDPVTGRRFLFRVRNDGGVTFN